MTSGRHVYPFSIVLPQHIPSSLEHENGSVRYGIKGTMERPWKFDLVTEIPFIVKLPFDLNLNSHLMVRINAKYRLVFLLINK